MNTVIIIGRILFAMAFVLFGINHLSKRKDMVGYAQMMKVPTPSLLVPLTGLMIIAGGLSIAFGFYARIGAILLVIFMVPTTFIMHQFWGVEDKQTAQMQMTMFLKNLSMLGGALIIVYLYSVLESVPLSIN